MLKLSLVEQIKAKATFTVVVPKEDGHFQRVPAIILEDVLEVIEPLMAHLQTFPRLDTSAENPCKEECLEYEKWFEELDKHMGVKK